MTKLRAQMCVVLLALCLSFAAQAQAQNLFSQPPGFGGTGQTTTADFNHDGKADLASADGTVQLGNGDGTFTAAPSLGFSGNTFIATADFNGDGKPDILLDTRVFLGNGDGTFQSPLMTITATNVSGIAVADVNGDGKPDVLVLVGGAVIVFLGKGDGTFTTTNLSYGNSGTVLAVGDFNGDGKPDILLASGSNDPPGGSLQVLLGNGDGTFQPAIATPIGMTPTVVLDDVNGDGKLDAIVSSGSQVFVFLGKGDGTFEAAGAPISAPGAFAIADVNGDGKPDLVSNQTFTQVFLGNGDGTFTLKSSVFGRSPSFGGSSSMLIADFNGDGKPDIAVANSLLFGNGDGTFQGSPALSLDSGPTGRVTTSDFNGDASLDVAFPSGANLYILLNNGNGGFVVAHTYPLGFAAQSIATADVNKDGKLDLLLTVADATTGALSMDVMLGNGDGTFAAPTAVLPSIPSALTQAGVTDFNGDQVPDLAFNATEGLQVFLGKGDGTFGSPAFYPVSSSGPDSVTTADFNGDGITDALAGSSVLLGKGDGTFQSPVALNAACGTEIEVVGDVNGDGKADLVSSSGTGFGSDQLEVCLSNGDGTFTALTPVPGYARLSSFPFIADLNGDGKADLVETYMYGSSIYLGNGDGTFTVGLPLGDATMVPFLIADVTGDSRPDAVMLVNSSQTGLITLINVSGPVTPDFKISASSLSPQTVAAGSAATATVTLAPTNGFAGTVALSCVGLPAGANCNFTPSSLPNGSGTSALTITTTSATPANTYFVSVIGSSGGSTRVGPTHSSLTSFTVVAVPDFSITSGSTGTATVTPGQTATYTLSIASNGGFTGSVTLTCSGAPSEATCSVSPAMVSVIGTTAANPTVTVSTTAPSPPLLPSFLARPPRAPNERAAPLLLECLLIAGFLSLFLWRRDRRLRAVPVFTFALSLCAGLAMTSCGSGSSGGGGGGGGNPGTPAGTYTITVTATATSGSTTITHSTKLILVVQ